VLTPHCFNEWRARCPCIPSLTLPSRLFREEFGATCPLFLDGGLQNRGEAPAIPFVEASSIELRPCCRRWIPCFFPPPELTDRGPYFAPWELSLSSSWWENCQDVSLTFSGTTPLNPLVGSSFFDARVSQTVCGVFWPLPFPPRFDFNDMCGPMKRSGQSPQLVIPTSLALCDRDHFWHRPGHYFTLFSLPPTPTARKVPCRWNPNFQHSICSP